MDNYILVAIPLFIFMAQLLDQSGVAESLFSTMRYLFGPIRGGIAVAVVVVSTLFGACTGIIGASVVTMGLLAMPVLLKYGYDKKLSSGVYLCGRHPGNPDPPQHHAGGHGRSGKRFRGKTLRRRRYPRVDSVRSLYPVHSDPVLF